MQSLRKPKDLIAGALFFAAGIVVVVLSSQYEIGTIQEMGPGYFPMALGTLLCILAALIIAASFGGAFEGMEPLTARSLRAVLLVSASALIFGLTVRSAGLIPSIFAMVLLGSFAMKGYGYRAAIITALSLSMCTALIFVWALAQPIPLFGF